MGAKASQQLKQYILHKKVAQNSLQQITKKKNS